MADSTAQRTERYIAEHPHIQRCLRHGIVNYSALARLIAQDLKISNATSLEAILIAARRYEHKLKRAAQEERKIRELLKDSEISLKNKIAVYIVDKSAKVEQDEGIISVIEGASAYTIIAHERVKLKAKHRIVHETHGLALLIFASPKSIEGTPGVIAYLTSLFAENGVNIVELLSCWTDTLFVISTTDAPKAMRLLEF